MSTRPNPLKSAMLGIQHQSASADVVTLPAPNPSAAPPTRASEAPSRRGKRSVSGHFDPAVQRQLRVLAAETDRTTQDLIGEALNDLFRKYNRSAIAS